MREELIGRWRAVRSGASLGCLAAVDADSALQYVFKEDGMAEIIALTPAGGRDWEWYVVDDRLLMTVPVDAVPAQGSNDESAADICEQIIALGEERLILDSHPFGGQTVTVFERVS
jgi:hypothetical protein